MKLRAPKEKARAACGAKRRKLTAGDYSDRLLAEQIHAVASDSNVVEDWNKAVLFRKFDVLTDDEKKAWYGGDDRYTTLSKQKAGLPNQLPTPHSRKVVEQDLLTVLCVKGAPSPRKIQAAFGRADAA